MDFLVVTPFLEEVQTAMEGGDLDEARTALEACLAKLDPDPVYEAWSYEAPPLAEGVLDFLTKNKTIHKLAGKAGIHTKTNVRDDLQQIHQAGQNAIAMSDRAHQYNRGATSKHAIDHPDQDVSIAQHHSAIKAHNAVIQRLDHAAKRAQSAGDKDAMAWIQQARDVHTQHRDWNMKMARNQRFNGPLAQQFAKQKHQDKMNKVRDKAQLNAYKASLGAGHAQNAPKASTQTTPSAPTKATPQAAVPTHAAGPPAAQPWAGRSTVNPHTGKRVGMFNPQTGHPMPQTQVPASIALARIKSKGKGKGKKPAALPQVSNEALEFGNYADILEAISR